MKVAIEARALNEKSGVGTYVRELVNNLRAIAGDDQIETLPSLANKKLLPLWLNFTVPRHIKRTKPDIVHFTKADVPSHKRVPTVVTIHDIIPLQLPESQSLVRRLYWPTAFKRAASLSDHIMTNSQASKKDIVNVLNVDPQRVSATPFAVDLEHFHPIQQPAQKIPYILFVGRWDLRKNIPALLQAFASIRHAIPHQLVIAGRPADKRINLRRDAAELGLIDRIIFKEDVAYKDLPALYAGTDLFVYPSIAEGWGFPPQEAMACGAPVVVSNAGSLPEVVGEAGRIVSFTTENIRHRLTDNQFIEQLAMEMRQIVNNVELRNRLSETGLQYVKKFSWKRVAEQTLAVYKSLV